MPSLFTPSRLLLLALSVGVGRFIRSNPVLFGLPAMMGAVDAAADAEFYDKMIYYRQQDQHASAVAVLDRVLDVHRVDLGADYDSYRNHCLRVLSFAVYFLKTESRQPARKPGDDINKVELPMLRSTYVMSYAIAYHDLGLWTTVPDDDNQGGGQLDYLAPSVAVMDRDWPSIREGPITKSGGAGDDEEKEPKAVLPDFTEQELETARQIILQHHKLTEWTPGAEGADAEADAALVNAVRKADWADFTVGVVRFGMPSGLLKAGLDALPEAGFHKALLGLGARLSPDSLVGRLDVLKIFKW